MAPRKRDHVVYEEIEANAGSPNVNGFDSTIVTNFYTSTIASNGGESQHLGTSAVPEETAALLNRELNSPPLCSLAHILC